MTRPRGRPPTPSATSRPTEPVGMTSIAAISPPSSGMIAPLPNCFSMAAIAPATAFIFSLMLDMVSPFCWSLVQRSRVGRARGTASVSARWTARTAALPSRSAMVRATRRMRVMARADRPRRSAARSSSAWPAASIGATQAERGRAEPRVPAACRAARWRSRGRHHALAHDRGRFARFAPGELIGTAAPGRRRAGRCDRGADPRGARGSRRSPSIEQVQVRTALPR